MFISTNFTYDNSTSDEMGVWLVRVETGLVEQNFGIPRTTITEKIKGRKRPYLYGFTEEVIKFSITLAKSNTNHTWTLAEKRSICTWLFKNSYKDFVSDDDIEIVYKCVAVGSPKFYTSTNEDGYCVVDFECDAPHPWSASNVQTFDLSSISSATTIQIQNLSNIDDYYYPELEFQLKSTATAFKLVNNNDGGRIFEFTGLNALETVYINNETKQIISDSGNYRYSALTDKRFFRLPYGTSNCVISYPCIITVRSQFPIAK